MQSKAGKHSWHLLLFEGSDHFCSFPQEKSGFQTQLANTFMHNVQV